MRRWLLAVPLLAAAPAGPDGAPDGYRMRVPIAVAGDARLQRIVLPAAVLAALQTRDGRDLRVFDARGRAMPMARGATGAVARTPLSPMPILGAPDALKVSGVSLRLDGEGRAQVAEVSGAPVAAGDAPVLLGMLFDARALAGRGERLVVDADVPQGQPVMLSVAASADLSAWRRIGETTVYRRPGDATALAVPLAGAGLSHDYLRVTWRAESRLIAPVVVRGAVLAWRGDGAEAGATVAAVAPAPDDPRAIAFAVPFATPVASLRIVPAREDDAVIPVRILGRDDREQPWALLGTGIATRSDTPRGAIALDGRAARTLRIEADARSPGFATAPTLAFGFAPRAVVFLASGSPPYALTAGRAGAADAFLAAGDLSDGRGAPGEARVGGAASSPIRLEAPGDAGASRRTLVLWGVLLAATGLLAGVAWLLWRQRGTVAA